MNKYTLKTFNIGSKQNTEPAYYPYINIWLSSRGFGYQRIEGIRAIPDYLIWDKNQMSLMEVKMYRGSKDLDIIDPINELKWQPGQQGYRKRLMTKNVDHYYLMILNKKGECYII